MRDVRLLLAGMASIAVFQVLAFEKVALVDAWDYHAVYDVESEAGLKQVVDHVLKTGADRVLWRTSSGAVPRYPSKEELSGQPSVVTPEDKRRIPSSRGLSGWMYLHREAVDHLGTAARFCRERTVAFGLHWSMEENHMSGWTLGAWNLAHPQFWCRRRDGAPWPGRTSEAWRVVEEHRLRLADEMVSYGPDTVLLDFYRSHGGSPEWDYVKPIEETWRQRHGCEPPDDWQDPRWSRHVSRYRRMFIKKLREHLSGKRLFLAVSRIGAAEDYDLVQRGVDWRTLVRDGLVDGLVVLCVVPDAKDPWNSTRKIYGNLMHEVEGRCKVYFPVSAYSHPTRPGISEYQRMSQLTKTETVRRLLDLAAEAGGAGIVMECVDHGNYPPEVCETIRRFEVKRTEGGTKR